MARSIQNIFEKIIEERGCMPSAAGGDQAHPAAPCGAILGLFQSWGPEDTQNLDTIVHTVFLLMTGHIPAGKGPTYKKQMGQFCPDCKAFYNRLFVQNGEVILDASAIRL